MSLVCRLYIALTCILRTLHVSIIIHNSHLLSMAESETFVLYKVMRLGCMTLSSHLIHLVLVVSIFTHNNCWWVHSSIVAALSRLCPELLLSPLVVPRFGVWSLLVHFMIITIEVS